MLNCTYLSTYRGCWGQKWLRNAYLGIYWYHDFCQYQYHYWYSFFSRHKNWCSHILRLPIFCCYWYQHITPLSYHTSHKQQTFQLCHYSLSHHLHYHHHIRNKNVLTPSHHYHHVIETDSCHHITTLKTISYYYFHHVIHNTSVLGVNTVTFIEFNCYETYMLVLWDRNIGMAQKNTSDFNNGRVVWSEQEDLKMQPPPCAEVWDFIITLNSIMTK